MDNELLDKVKMAQRLYYLAVKNEKKIPQNFLLFAKETYNNYIKAAKEKDLRLSEEELIRLILK
ncbi:hypothetical protein Q428_11340 [Fervidicella metallireducens AeB]|uniref:Uncharacterized protein n=1 Tax=Fervidicella metallireducens AeB TaxID=1403537 RepID=A0A017RT08_9CLOT|nr:hypothetical protein [Fervidicella metallireducens]EYE87807.1 hypothetical protein Q428_11340 [Fervidicella metallireducens AeB]